MKPLLRILFVLLTGWVASSQALAACAPTQVLRDDVLVVVNDNSISSPQVGDYYCEQRGIDPANVAHVRVPVTNDVELDQFISLRDQLIKHMLENTLPQGVVPAACDTSQGYTKYYCPETVDQLRQQGRIRYVVTTKGIPIRFSFTGTTLCCNPDASVDNYLRFWLTNYFPQDVAFNINDRAIAFGDGRGMRTVDPSVDRELIVGRVDGVDVESARRLVDRAINAEHNGIYGKLYGNKFGGTMDQSGPEGAYWKSWLPDGSTATVYPSWRYLHGLFGDFQSLSTLAIRHVANPECLTYGSNGKVPGACVTAVNRGAISDSFSTGDVPPGTPWSRIPEPDNALVHQGYVDTLSVNHEFAHLLNWRDNTGCNTLCLPGDTSCTAASTDAYKEIDTRCVRLAEGFIGYQYSSYPVGMMASWPTGWFQSGTTYIVFSNFGSYNYYFWEPEVRDDEGAGDNFSLWYRDTDNIPGSACYAGTEDYQSPPANNCLQEKKININQAVDIPERAINLANPQQITVRFKYRGIDLDRNARLFVRLMLRESQYNDGVITIGSSHQTVYNQIKVTTLSIPNDPADGTSWGDAVATFTLDPSLHIHPQYLYNGIKIRITVDTMQGQFAIDDVSLEEDGVPIPLVNPSFNDGHRQLSGGDSAASFLSRLNGVAFWGNLTHHESHGHSFDAHPYETLIYFMRGLPLGDAVWFAEMHNGGILYGDPLYSPVAVHMHYRAGSDSRAPKDNFYTAADSPLALTGDTLNGTGTDVTTTYSVDYCSGDDFLPCDQNGSWLPVAGIQNRPGGQRNQPLGSWAISGLAAGDYVLRLAVTSANSTSGLSQTFYDYYPVTLYTPASDTDADGLGTQQELALGTSPFDDDTDADGLPDGWEVDNLMDPLAGNTNNDSDNDTFTDFIEYLRATDPTDNQSFPSVALLEVDPVNGADNGQSPFKTAQAAVAAAQAGDTVMLLPGSHFDTEVIFNTPVNFQGSSAPGAVLQAFFLTNNTPGAVTIRDLDVATNGLKINGQAIRIERVAFNANVDIDAGASVEIVNSLFTNAGSNALNILGDAGVVLENCTLTANDTGVRSSATASVQIINSIISGNATADLVGVPLAAVSYTLTGDAAFAGSNGNIGGNPLFVAPQSGNYHLQPGSPAVDTGDPLSDFSLEPPSGVGRINMGRYGNTAEAAVAPVDFDGDGLSDQEEAVLGTDPMNSDTDGDGFPDGWEVSNGFNPLSFKQTSEPSIANDCCSGRGFGLGY